MTGIAERDLAPLNSRGRGEYPGRLPQRDDPADGNVPATADDIARTVAFLCSDAGATHNWNADLGRRWAVAAI
jgi:hypothetical protein